MDGGGEASGGGRPGHLSMAVVAAKALEGVTITPSAPTDATVLLVTTDTVSGFCSPNPGSLFYRINYDDSSGVFFGTMQFFSYCFDGVSLTGSASITGRVEPLSLLFLTLDITFDSLTAVSSGDSFTGSGSMSYDYTTLSTTATLNMDLRDDSTSEIFRLDGVSFTITDVTPSLFRVAINGGKFFHPDFGHVTVSTASGASLEFVVGDEFPRSGVFTLSGAGGTASKLTVLSNTQYMVTADTNGDGAFDDFASANLLWADL